MSWLWPEGWWLPAALPAGLLLLAAAARRRRARLGRFAEEARHPDLLAALHPGRRRLRQGLLLAAFALAALAGLGPAWGYTLRQVQHRGVDLLFLLDLSRSMLAADLAPSRLERARRDVLGLLGRLTGERVGLVAFSGSPVAVCPLTHDYGAFAELLRRADPNLPAVGGTDLGAGLRLALHALGRGFEAHQAVLLLSDGEDLGGEWREALAEAAARRVRVYAVGYGTPEGAKITVADGARQAFLRGPDGAEVVSRLDEAVLAEVARASGGEYLAARAGPLPLEEILEKRIRALQRREYDEEERRVPWNRYQWPLAAAVAALLVRLLLPPGRRWWGPVPLLLAALCLPGFPARAAEEPARAGLSRLEAGRPGEALPLLEDALARAREGGGRPAPELLYDLGLAALQAGRAGRAREAFLEARAGAPSGAPARSLAGLGLGAALWRLGEEAEKGGPQGLEEALARTREAREAWVRTLREDPGLDPARRNIERADRRLEELERRRREQASRPASRPAQSQPAGEQEPGEGQERTGKPEEKAGKPEEKPGQPEENGKPEEKPGQPHGKPEEKPGQPQEKAGRPREGAGEPGDGEARKAAMSPEEVQLLLERLRQLEERRLELERRFRPARPPGGRDW